jgi:CHRD domain
MFKQSYFIKVAVLASAVLMTACAETPKSSAVAMTGALTASAENPPNASTGTGNIAASLDKETSKLKWTVSYAGLSGPVVAAHFHGPAQSGQNAGVVLGFQGSLTSPIEGEATLTAAQAADVLAGKWYVNLHTKVNPGGEVRAQVVVK